MKFKRVAIKNRPTKKWMLWGILGVLMFSSLLVPFTMYINGLFGKLDQAFLNDQEFIPTRFYSDVTRLSAPYPRPWVEKKLKALGYSLEQAASPSEIQFTLHEIDYPLSLLPPEHPTVRLAQKKIRLVFEKTGDKNSLKEIKAYENSEWKDLNEIYLEPEIFATLSQNGDTEKKEIRRNLKFKDIPSSIWQAIISIEDQHFMEHKGLDPRGIARALLVNLKSGSLAQGGSTITSQLVKNLMERQGKNLFKKANELLLAILIEQKYSKEQILERYLNEVYLGQVGAYGVRGIAEGAKLFYGKEIEELNLGEIALMAGLIRGPAFYSPYSHRERAIERQKLVLTKMLEQGYISEEEAKIALKDDIRLAPPLSYSNKAPYFTDYVKSELQKQLKEQVNSEDVASAGFKVYTTLDTQMSELAQKSLAEGLDALEKKLGIDSQANPEERLEGILASVDHSKGFIRALIGGRSYSYSTFNRILNMKRPVGSTFKPFVYLTAYQKNIDPRGIPYTPSYPIEDAPWTLSFDQGRQKWSPQNYDKKNRGWITLRAALSESINTVASRIGAQVGIESVIQTAKDLGIESELPAVPSLTLGVAELSPVELVKAYSAIANHGLKDELTVIREIQNQDRTVVAHFEYTPKQVYDQASIELLIESMQELFKTGTAAAASSYGFTRQAAGKTGTTSAYKDAWFAGFTPELTSVVWVGMDQNKTVQAKVDETKSKNKKKKKLEMTGASGALPIWATFMKQALESSSPRSFPKSELLKEIRIDLHSGFESTSSCPETQVRVEWVKKEGFPGETKCEAFPMPFDKEVVISN